MDDTEAAIVQYCAHVLSRLEGRCKSFEYAWEYCTYIDGKPLANAHPKEVASNSLSWDSLVTVARHQNSATAKRCWLRCDCASMNPAVSDSPSYELYRPG